MTDGRRDFDVLVIGGGPGGSAAALTLRQRGLSVAVLEKDRHPRFHIGESLLPRNLGLMEELGVAEAVADLPHLDKYGAAFMMAHGRGEAAHMGFDQGLIAGRPTWNVERAAFDDMLLRRCEAAGASVFEETPVKSIDRLDAGGCAVTTRLGTFTGRMLLDASGHGTVVGRHTGRRRTDGDANLRRVAYFEHFSGADMPRGRDAGTPKLIMADEGWFWLIGLDGRRTSVGFVAEPTLCKEIGVPADRMLRWAVERAPAVRRHLKHARGPATNRVVADFTYTCAPFFGPGHFLVGDAAFFLDPIFSTGVTLAMIGGNAAANHAADVLEGKATMARAGRAYTKLVRQSSGPLAWLIRRFYRHEFRELLLASGSPLRVRRAIISVLAGQVFPRPAWALRWRLGVFRAMVPVQRRVAIVPRHDRWSLRDAAPEPVGETLSTRLAAHDPARPAYVAPDGETLTYGDLLARATRLAATLGDGEGRLLRCPNRLDFPVWFLAARLAGVTLMPVPCGTNDAEAARLAARAGVGHPVGSVAAAMRAAVPADSVHPELRPAGPQLPLPTPRAVASRPSDDRGGGIVLPSSGSTDVPSLVRRSAASLDAMARNVADAVGLTPADRVLATVPLAHSYGLEHGLLGPLWAGATVLLCPGLDAAALRKQLARSPTIVPAVPAMIELLPRLADDPAVVDAVRKTRAVYSAGAPLPADARDRFAAAFGQRAGQVYGMTEIGSVTYNDPADADFDPAGVGRPMSGVSIRLLDGGEVAVRAPSMLDGYADAPLELVDGHLPTGDLGAVDDAGRLTILGRRRLLIDVGGRKVNPLEVEAVLREHAGVADVAVVAVRQSETSSRLRAVVVPRDPASPPADLRAFARDRLPGWKVPRSVEFRDALPRTATGKVARKELETS